MKLTTEQNEKLLANATQFKNHTQFYFVGVTRIVPGINPDEHTQQYYVPLVKALESFKNTMNAAEYLAAVQSAVASL